MLDILLAVGIALITAFLTLEGLRPTAPSRHRTPLIVAALVFSILFAGVQAYRNSATSEQVASLVNTDVEFAHRPVDGIQSIEPGKLIKLDVDVRPLRNPAKKLQFASGFSLVEGSVSASDVRPWNGWLSKYRENGSRQYATELPKNRWMVSTQEFRLHAEDISKLLGGSARMYLFALAKWNNVSGSESKAASCVYAELAPTTLNLQIDETTMWHTCATTDAF